MFLTSYGYLAKKVSGKLYYMHRIIWESYYGRIPDDYCVHHKDGNKLNNDIKNLELLKRGEHTRHHNEGNDRAAGKHKYYNFKVPHSHVPGVTWFGRDNTWLARITVDGRQVYVGNYNTIPEAVEAINNYKAQNQTR